MIERDAKGRIKKGFSGNPKGRTAKIRHIPDILSKIGQETPPDKILSKISAMFPDADEMTFLEAVMRYVYIFALQGQSWAVQYIADRTEGKPKQSVEVTTKKKRFDGENPEQYLKEMITPYES